MYYLHRAWCTWSRDLNLSRGYEFESRRQSKLGGKSEWQNIDFPWIAESQNRYQKFIFCKCAYLIQVSIFISGLGSGICRLKPLRGLRFDSFTCETRLLCSNSIHTHTHSYTCIIINMFSFCIRESNPRPQSHPRPDVLTTMLSLNNIAISACELRERELPLYTQYPSHASKQSKLRKALSNTHHKQSNLTICIQGNTDTKFLCLSCTRIRVRIPSRK